MGIRPENNLSVLLVDDEASALSSNQRTLQTGGIEHVICCQDARDAQDLLNREDIGAVLLDLSMPHICGQELLGIINEEYPDVPVIIATGFNDVEIAVECMRLGAFDYMVKPIENSRMISSIQRALELHELRYENEMLKERLFSHEIQFPEAFATIVTSNPTMRSIFQYIETIATTHKPVLITGETGSGKEPIANVTHKLSGRKGDFIAINVAGVDDNVFSDTLLGHAKGAFTGADTARSGLVDQAKGGTLFLDEIGDLSSASQVKLLRLIQERKYFPLGSDIPRRSEARFIFSTNCDLEDMVQQGQFRKDLYYRLKTHHIKIPPLRERLDDIPLLLEHFLRETAKELNKDIPTPPKELITLLKAYHFPGNIRELEGMVYDAVSNHSSKMLSMDIFKEHTGIASHKDKIQDNEDPHNEQELPFVFRDEFPTLKEVGRSLIAEAMKKADGNLSIASNLLGISRQALSKRLKRYSED